MILFFLSIFWWAWFWDSKINVIDWKFLVIWVFFGILFCNDNGSWWSWWRIFRKGFELSLKYSIVLWYFFIENFIPLALIRFRIVGLPFYLLVWWFGNLLILFEILLSLMDFIFGFCIVDSNIQIFLVHAGCYGG